MFLLKLYIQKIKHSIIPLLMISFFIFSPFSVNADILKPDKKQEFDNNLTQISTDSGYSAADNLENTIATIIKIILSVLGTIFLLLMSLAGNKWMRASGNQEKISQAKKEIVSLVIGLIIILAAYAISSWASGILANILIN